MVPTITTLLKIAAALECPVGYFIDVDDGVPESVTLTRAGTRPAVSTPHTGLRTAVAPGPRAHYPRAPAAALGSAVGEVRPGAVRRSHRARARKYSSAPDAAAVLQ